MMTIDDDDNDECCTWPYFNQKLKIDLSGGTTSVATKHYCSQMSQYLSENYHIINQVIPYGHPAPN